MTELEKLSTANPRGRLDVALFRMGDAIGRRELPQEWPQLRQDWATIVAALNGKHRRAFSQAVVSIGDAIGTRKLPEIWPHVREHWQTLAQTLLPAPRRRRRSSAR